VAAFVPSMELARRACLGDLRAVARLLTRAEAGSEECCAALDEMFRRAGTAHVIGITGVPGSGKSTLVAKLARGFRSDGRRVAIVAIDPSSPFSGGSILGDRIRMNDLGDDPGVFVRSMATRGALGGLARNTLEAVDVLDAAGFAIVMIETVGVGQDEVDIVRAAHTTVVVSAPGLGDDIQAIKAGILEIADIHVVSKSDKPEANKTIADLKGMLALSLALGRSAASLAPIVATSAQTGAGVAELVSSIDRHRASLAESGEMARRTRSIAERRVLRAAEEILHDEFLRHRDRKMDTLLASISARELSPRAAARELFNQVRGEIQT
jgi:LAO/AO transport system kinase